MARVTVEDCTDKVDTLYELVVLAAQRANEIAAGSALTLDRDNDKNTVVSLREIAEGTVTVEDMRENVVRNLQRPSELDDYELVEGQLEGQAEEGAKAEKEPSPEELAATVEAQVENDLDEIQKQEEVIITEDASDTMSFAEDNLDVND